MLRNAVFGLVALFYVVPLGWILLLLVGLPIIAFESWMVWTDRLGIRIGDIFADTQVVDGKVVTRSRSSPPTPSRCLRRRPRRARRGWRATRRGPPDGGTRGATPSACYRGAAFRQGQREESEMARSKSRRMRVKTQKKQSWKARRKRQKAAKKAPAKK